ncbi:hypothetical protein [Arthrobacter sp. Soil736]|uniref:hypothetical protein n=1 Tax=Arthrobacter sp. Soil736 TaxID=1736395 RepID=UPI0012FA455D|nr:hypothetical protein [Arthrobacter sp. Soil736]
MFPNKGRIQASFTFRRIPLLYGVNEVVKGPGKGQVTVVDVCRVHYVLIEKRRVDGAIFDGPDLVGDGSGGSFFPKHFSLCFRRWDTISESSSPAQLVFYAGAVTRCSRWLLVFHDLDPGFDTFCFEAGSEDLGQSLIVLASKIHVVAPFASAVTVVFSSASFNDPPLQFLGKAPIRIPFIVRSEL